MTIGMVKNDYWNPSIYICTSMHMCAASCASWDLTHHQNPSMGDICQWHCNWYTESTTTDCRNHRNICEWRCSKHVVIIATKYWNNWKYRQRGTAPNQIYYCNSTSMCACWADLPLRQPDCRCTTVMMVIDLASRSRWLMHVGGGSGQLQRP
jgi:hypothetical protein